VFWRSPKITRGALGGAQAPIHPCDDREILKGMLGVNASFTGSGRPFHDRRDDLLPMEQVGVYKVLDGVGES